MNKHNTQKSFRFRKDFFVLILSVFVFMQTAIGQDSLTFTKQQKLLLYSESAFIVGSMATLAGAWYKEPKQNFHFFDDSKEWKQMDKAGHLMTSYTIANSNYTLLQGAGFKPKFAFNYVVGTTLAYMTFIEVLDGFSTAYGASLSDLGVNLAGVGLFALQEKTNTRTCFNLKYSYQKSDLAHFRPNLLGSNGAERLLKDYNAQTYWLSLNPAALTHSTKLPKWLNVAFGYGVKGFLGGNSNPSINEQGKMLPSLQRSRQFYLSFDMETRNLFPKHKTLNRIVSIVSFIKIPMPGIVFTQNEQLRFCAFCR